MLEDFIPGKLYRTSFCTETCTGPMCTDVPLQFYKEFPDGTWWPSSKRMSVPRHGAILMFLEEASAAAPPHHNIISNDSEFTYTRWLYQDKILIAVLVESSLVNFEAINRD